MTNWILVISLLFLYIIIYMMHGKKIGPSNILVLSFLVPSFLVAVYYDYFLYDISVETIFIVNTLILVFALGEMSQYRRCDKSYPVSKQCPQFYIGRKLYCFFLLIVTINLLIQYNYIIQLGALMDASNFISAYAASRLLLVDYQNTGELEVKMPYYGILISLVASIVEIICFHVYVSNRVTKKYNDRKLLVIIVIYFISLFFATGRAAFFPKIIHAIYVTFVFLRNRMRINQIFRKYRLQIFTFILVVSSIFLGLGALRQNVDGDDSVNMDASFTVTTYIAAPMIGLDIYINKGMQQGTYIGEHTFKDYYDYARLFGVPYRRIQFHKDDFYAGKGSSNVYTGFYYWLSDFSLIGAYLYALFLGSVLGYFYYRKVNLSSISEIYIRSFLYYATVLMFYDDQFNNVFSLFMAVTIVAIRYIQKKILIV